MSSAELIQKLYVGYYGRPADPVGLAFWLQKYEAEGLESVLGAFSNSAESQALYGDAPDNTELVSTIYQQLFDRFPDEAGWAFYTNALDDGRFSPEEIILAVIDGAQNEDAALIGARLNAATAVTEYLEASSGIYAGSRAAEIGRDFLESVDMDVASTEAAAIAQLIDTASVYTDNLNSLFPPGSALGDFLQFAPPQTTETHVAGLLAMTTNSLSEVDRFDDFLARSSFPGLLQSLESPEQIEALLALQESEQAGALLQLLPAQPEVLSALDQNSAILQLAGSGEAGTTLIVSLRDNDNTDILYEVTVSSDGSWEVDFGTADSQGRIPVLAIDGSYPVELQLVDAEDNRSEILELVINRDTEAPTNSLSQLSFSADTGVSDTDFITASAEQTLTAVLSAPLAQSEQLQASLDGGLNWIDVSEFVTGLSLVWNEVQLVDSGTLALKFVDLAGNESAIVSQAYILDQDLPIFSSVNLNVDGTPRSSLREGDSITISFVSSEALADIPQLNILGASFTPEQLGPFNYQLNLTIDGSMPEGTIDYILSGADLAGNVGTLLGDSDLDVDLTAPELLQVTIVSDNINNQLARPGDTVQIFFAASEPLASNPEVMINGNNASVSRLSSDQFFATYVMGSNGDDVDGAIGFSISFSDNAGNLGVPVTITTDDSEVIYDGIASSVQDVSIASSRSDPGIATLGDEITLQFFVDEPLLSLPVVTIAGESAVVEAISASEYLARLELNNDMLADGEIDFGITITDLAGNVSAVVSASDDGSAVVFDNTAPQFFDVSMESSNPRPDRAGRDDTVTLLFSVDDILQQDPVVTIAGHSVETLALGDNRFSASYVMNSNPEDSDGPVTFFISAENQFGQSASTADLSTGETVIFDETAPFVTAVKAPESGVYVEGDILRFDVEFSENISVLNSQASIQLFVDDGSVINFQLAAQIDNVLSFESTVVEGFLDINGVELFRKLILNGDVISDETGNSVQQLDLFNIESTAGVQIDSVLPILESVSLQSDNVIPEYASIGNTVTLTLHSSEALSSDSAVSINNQQYVLEQVDTQEYRVRFEVDATDSEGEMSFLLLVNDLAGNNGVAVLQTTDGSSVTIDLDPPSINDVSIESSATISDQAAPGDTITLSFQSDEALQQLPQVSIESNSATVVHLGDNHYQASYVMNTNELDTDGTVEFEIQYLDLAGNAGAIVSATNDGTAVVYDESPPDIIAVSIPNQAMEVGDEVEISIFVEDDQGDEYRDLIGNVGGFELSEFRRVSSQEYIAYFTIAEGGNNVSADEDIPLELSITDSFGNRSDPYRTPIAQSSDSIDATASVIQDVMIPDQPSRIGDVILVSLLVLDDGGEAYRNVSGSVGGYDIGNLQRIDSTHYTVELSVVEGGRDFAANEEVPVSIQIEGADGEIFAPYIRSIVQGADSIDASAPQLTDSQPFAGATGVSLFSGVRLVFDEPIAVGDGVITITDGVDTQEIDVSSGQVLIVDNAITVNPANDLANSNSLYHVIVDPGAITDLAGNDFAGIQDSAQLQFRTVDTSVVIFDLVEGVSSSHSGRQFEADQTYTIYIRVANDSSQLFSDGNDVGDWGRWLNGDNLGADDKIIIVGNQLGEDIVGINGGMYSGFQRDTDNLYWQTSLQEDGYAAALARYGTFVRAFDGSTSNIDLWTNRWASSSSPNTSATSAGVYATSLPAYLLTTQGLF